VLNGSPGRAHYRTEKTRTHVLRDKSHTTPRTIKPPYPFVLSKSRRPRPPARSAALAVQCTARAQTLRRRRRRARAAARRAAWNLLVVDAGRPWTSCRRVRSHPSGWRANSPYGQSLGTHIRQYQSEQMPSRSAAASEQCPCAYSTRSSRTSSRERANGEEKL
jgi:hypothetical protein